MASDLPIVAVVVLIIINIVVATRGYSVVAFLRKTHKRESPQNLQHRLQHNNFDQNVAAAHEYFRFFCTFTLFIFSYFYIRKHIYMCTQMQCIWFTRNAGVRMDADVCVCVCMSNRRMWLFHFFIRFLISSITVTAKACLCAYVCMNICDFVCLYFYIQLRWFVIAVRWR